jgi:hypothetical protein
MNFERGFKEANLSTAEAMIKSGLSLDMVKKCTQLDKKTLVELRKKLTVAI